MAKRKGESVNDGETEKKKVTVWLIETIFQCTLCGIHTHAYEKTYTQHQYGYKEKIAVFNVFLDRKREIETHELMHVSERVSKIRA